MPRYNVISEFVDSQSKKRKLPGDVIETDGKRAKELESAGVIGSEVVEPSKKEVTQRGKKSK